MAKKENQLATYSPPLQQNPQAQYNPYAPSPYVQNPYAPQGYQQQVPYQPMQPYIPRTQPITPTVSPVNPSSAVLSEESVIIAPKKPPKSARPITLKSLFWGIILLVLFTFIAFMVAAYFIVDSYNPFKIIGDFFTTFDFGKFFKELFAGPQV